MTLVTRCEVCDVGELVPFLDLGSQPLPDDLVPFGSMDRPAAYPLKLAACPHCITVHQQEQVAKHLLFPKSYHYRAAMTQDVLAGMHELAERAREIMGDLSGKQVLDVGCNDGSLLAIFREMGARTAGIEPTGAASDAETRADLVINRFFDANAVEDYLSACPPPDLITFTNVFAHIEDLNELLANLSRLMKHETKLIIENHYLGAVVDRLQFDTFYHEHPRTYSQRSFAFIARKLGRAIESVEFPPRYNGNVRVVIGEGPPGIASKRDESHFLASLLTMREHIDRSRVRTLKMLEDLVHAHGPLPAKAFPARASILLHTFGIDERLIDAVYERSGSPKIGHFIPGTSIPILDEAVFFRERMESPVMINLAWHIQAEIEHFMRTQGYSGEILAIYS